MPFLILRAHLYSRPWIWYPVMINWHEYIDCVGGPSCEVATLEEICCFYQLKGFSMEKLNIWGGYGYNELFFEKATNPQ